MKDELERLLLLDLPQHRRQEQYSGFFEQFEIALACHSCGSQVCHNVRNWHAMRAGLDHQRPAYPWLGHDQMVPLLAFEHETIHFKNLHQFLV